MHGREWRVGRSKDFMERRVLGLLYGPRALELRGAPMLEAMAEALIQGNSSELSP
jgi:hypothetical protein